MVDVIQRLILEAETGDTNKQLQDVRKQQERLAKEIRESAKDTEKTKNETRELVDQYKALVDSERNLEKQLRDTNDAYGDRRRALEAQEKFDRTSQGVALAGDVESNLRTVGGAAGAFGLGGVERGIGAAAEIPAVIEALPRLKESLVGLPAAAQQAAQAIGLSSGTALIGAIGGITIVAIAASAAMKEYQKAIDENKTAIQAAVDTIRDVNNFVSDGATTEDIQQELAEINRLREDEIALIERTKQAQQNFADSAIVPALAKLRGDYKEFNAEIEASEQTIATLDLREKELTDSRHAAAIAANDAAQAEAERENALAQSALQEAQLAGQLVELKANALDFTTEELDVEKEKLRVQKESINAQLAVLQASEIQNDAIKAQIATLEASIAGVDASIEALNSSEVKQAVSANDAKKAEEELRKEREKSARTTAGATVAEANRRHSGGFSRRAGSRQLANPIVSAELEAMRDAGNERLDLIKDFNQRELEIRKESIFDQKQALERFRFDEKKLLEQGSFSAAFDARRDRAFEQRQTGERLRFDADNRMGELLNRLNDLTVQIAIQPSPQFDVRVQSQSQAIASNTVRRSSGLPFPRFGGR